MQGGQDSSEKFWLKNLPFAQLPLLPSSLKTQRDVQAFPEHRPGPAPLGTPGGRAPHWAGPSSINQVVLKPGFHILLFLPREVAKLSQVQREMRQIHGTGFLGCPLQKRRILHNFTSEEWIPYTDTGNDVSQLRWSFKDKQEALVSMGPYVPEFLDF